MTHKIFIFSDDKVEPDKSLTKYKNGEDVSLKDLSIPLFFYILQERWKVILMLVLLMLFAFFVGYYVGYNNALVSLQNNNVQQIAVDIGAGNWTIQ